MGRRGEEPIGVALAGSLVTFLRTDVEGSSRLWQSPGDAMDAAIDLHDALLAAGIRRNGGTIERTEGDSFFAVFPRPSQAVAAAFEIQRELGAQAWPCAIRLRVRVGIHTGEAGRVGPGGRVDTRGLEANICGRVSDVARGGQVLLTLPAALFARHALPEGAALRDDGWHVLRDVAEPQRLYELVAEGPAVSYTREDVDRGLAELAHKVRTVAADLLELQDLVDYRLLRHLAAEPMRRLSRHVEDLGRLVDRAARLRGASAELRPDRAQELATMLAGPSIRLHPGRVPIELRGLVEDPDACLWITPEDLLRAIENLFEVVRTGVLDDTLHTERKTIGLRRT